MYILTYCKTLTAGSKTPGLIRGSGWTYKWRGLYLEGRQVGEGGGGVLLVDLKICFKMKHSSVDGNYFSIFSLNSFQASL